MSDFVCQRCGNCCRVDGQVRLTDADIARLAGFMGLGEPAFIERYTQLARDRRGLVLIDAHGDACVFLKDNTCVVNEAKPEQCRGFPIRWTNPGWEATCAAKSPRQSEG